MAVASSTYIPVTSEVETLVSSQKVFAGISLTANTTIPTTDILQKFTSLAEVGTYFGTSSTEYTVASKYFAAAKSSNLRPPYIYFGKYIVVAIAPYLNSSKNTNTAALLTALQAITAGDITVSVNGTTYATTAINLSSATSLSNVATLLTTAITTANTALNSSGANFTITYNATVNKFVASIPGTGSTKTMNFFSSTNATTGLATVMGFTSTAGAVLSQGSDALTPTQNLTALSALFTDQFSIFFNDTMDSNLTDVINLEVAQWVHNAGDRYEFKCWTNLAAIETANDTTSIWYLINQAEYNNTAIFDEVLYNTADRVAAAAGIEAAVDLSQANSAITLAFKQQDGLLPSVTSTAIAEILNTKKINYYANVGIEGTANTVNWFYGGYTSGKWIYTDNLMGQIWIALQCQVNLINEFTNTNEIANDQDGQGLIRTALTDAVESAITSNIIVKGLTFSPETTALILSQYGVNAQELTLNGYIIINTLAGEALRQLRESTPWYILYAKGSAIQFIPVNTKTFF